MREKLATLTGLLVLNTLLSLGQVGTLDANFGVDGKVTTDFSGGSDIGNAVTIQQDGKIVVVGESSRDFGVARYNTDGSLDNSFGTSGRITTKFNLGGFGDKANGVAMQQDGKIVVAGVFASQFGVVRYNSDGSLDSTFNSDGIVQTDFFSLGFAGFGTAKSIAIQLDGKIVVAGYVHSYSSLPDFAVARYNTDGTLDNTFNFDGKVTADFGNTVDFGNSVSIQANGKILVAGSGNLDFAAVRFNTDGTLDSSFGTDGKIMTDFLNDEDFGNSTVIQPDGKIVIAGSSTSGSDVYFALSRYEIDGTLDSTFNNDGKVITSIGIEQSYGLSVALQPDGKILVAGGADNGLNGVDFALARYTTSGLLDISFLFGHVRTDFAGFKDIGSSIIVQPDGKILVTGYTFNGNDNDFALARYISGLDVGVVKEVSYPLIYPNPISHTAQLEFELIKNEMIDILLYDMNGKLAQSILRNVQKLKGQHKITLNFNSTITAGSYLIVIDTAEGKQAIKITIE